MLHKNISTLLENFQKKETNAPQEILDAILILSNTLQKEPHFLQKNTDPLSALKKLLENVTESEQEATSFTDLEKKQETKRYESLKILGKGGMGVVQLVRDTLLNREVAQKTVKEQNSRAFASFHEKMMLWRFRREAEITGQLEHPNIVPLYDLEEEQGELRFTMRKIEGETLREIFQKKRNGTNHFEEDQLLSIFLKVCEAVAYAHSKKIIHRDLKPENIMVGQFGEVYVMDWGIAKQQEQESVHEEEAFLTLNHGEIKTPSNQTRVEEDEKETQLAEVDSQSFAQTKNFKTQGGLGTPGYMSPEQCADAGSVTPESDIYALGQILRECYTFHSPMEEFHRAISQKPSLAFVQQKTFSFADFDQNIPEDIKAIVKKAKDPQKEERYREVLQLIEDIRRYQRHEWIQARDLRFQDFLEVGQKWLKRHPQWVITFSLLLLIFVGFQCFSYYQKKQKIEQLLQESHFLRQRSQNIQILDKSTQAEKIGYLLKAFNLLHETLRWTLDPQIQKKIGELGQELAQQSCESKDFQLALFVVDALTPLEAITLSEKEHLKKDVLLKRDQLEQKHLEELKIFKQKFLDNTLEKNESEEILIAISQMQEKAVFEVLTHELEEGISYFLENESVSPTYSSYYILIVKALGYLDQREANAKLFEGLKNIVQLFEQKQISAEHQIFMSEITQTLANLNATEDVAVFIGKIRTNEFSSSLYRDLSENAYKKLVGRSIEYYSKQIERDPNYAMFYKERGLAKLELGDHLGAEKDFDQFLQFHPKNGFVYHYRAIARMSQKKMQLALEDFNYSVQLLPEDSNLFSNRSSLKVELDDYVGAIEDLNEAIRLNPKSSNNYFNRASIQRDLNKDAEAIKDFEKVLELSPQDFLAYIELGFTKIKIKDYSGAIDELTKAILLNQKASRAYMWRGTAKHHLQNYTEALLDFNKAIQIEPKNIVAYEKRGLSKMELKDYHGAIADFDHQIKQFPTSSQAYVERGKAKASLKDSSGAIEDFSLAILHDKNNDKAYGLRADEYRKLKKYQNAIEDYTQVIRLSPKNSLAYEIRAEIKLILKEYKNALEDFSKAIELNPNEEKFYHNRAMVKYYLRDFLSALEDVDQSIKLAPDDFNAYNTRASIYLALKRYSEAIQDFHTVLKFKPEEAVVYYNIGLLYKNMNEFEQAINYLKKGLQIQQDIKALEMYLDLLIQIARKYFNKKDYQKAQQYLQEFKASALETHPQYQGVEKMLQKLEQQQK